MLLSYHQNKLVTHVIAHDTKWPLSLFWAMIRVDVAGPKFNENGVLMHCAATVLWEDGRRASIDCGLDRNMTQLMEVMHAQP